MQYPMLIDYLLLMLKSFTALFMIYLTGKIILSFFSVNVLGTFKLFLIYITGLTSVFLIYSVIKTNFLTVNIGFLPILFYIIYLKRDTITLPKLNYFNIKNDISLTLLIFIPIYLFQSYFFFDFMNGTFKPLHTDHYLYADFSNSLKLFGIESKFTDLNFYFANSNKLVPYHYPELWLTAFFSIFLKTPTVNAYFLIIIPVCVSIFSIGIFSLLDNKKVPFLIKYIFSILGLFISGIYFDIYNEFEITKYQHQADNSIFSLFSQKFCLIYIYILLSAILFLRNKRDLGLIVLSLVPILSISFAPGIVGGLFLYYLYKVFFKSYKIKISNDVSLFTSIFIGVFLLFFYSVNKGDYTSNVLDDAFLLNDIVNNKLNLSSIKIFIGNNIHRLFRPFIFYVPYAFIIWILILKNQALSFLYLLILFCGVFSSVILLGVLDSNQFASNTYIFFNVSIIIGISFFIEENKLVSLKRSLIFTVLLFLISTNIINISKNKNLPNRIIENKVFKRILTETDDENIKILVFLNRSDFSKIPFLSWWQLKNDLLPLTQYSNRNIIFTFGNPELFFKSKTDITSADKLFFNHLLPINYIKNNKYNYVKFIKTNNIKLLYVKKGVYLSPEINKQIKFELKSKELDGRMLILK
jgi:hypothetical protein